MNNNQNTPPMNSHKPSWLLYKRTTQEVNVTISQWARRIHLLSKRVGFFFLQCCGLSPGLAHDRQVLYHWATLPARMKIFTLVCVLWAYGNAISGLSLHLRSCLLPWPLAFTGCFLCKLCSELGNENRYLWRLLAFALESLPSLFCSKVDFDIFPYVLPHRQEAKPWP